MDPRELFGRDYQEFCESDPFNPNLVEGYISRRPNQFYGALLITKVNNHEVEPQLIMGTPKMNYPFDSRADGTRNYKFPPTKEIEIYEKLDGTNILAFSYIDKDGWRYFSYKTRLRPFVSSSRFGDFQNMWLEVVTPPLQACIKKIMVRNECNLSFELYGARNPHLVVYKDIPLAIALLFGVTNAGNVLPPTVLGTVEPIPVVKQFSVVTKDYVWNYETLQKTLEAGLKQEEEGYYSGTEGTVWYLKTLDGRYIQLKCKPETIEMIHFSAGAGGLGKNTIIATCWNSYENTDEPTVDFVKELLLEEFKPEIIEAHHYLIEKCLDFVKGEQQFRQDVLSEYKKIGKNILVDKVSVMRAMSTKFEKARMRKVYGIIKDFG